MPKTVVLTLRPEVAADVRRYAPLAARTAGVDERNIALLRVVKRSIDARQRQPRIHLTLELYADNDSEWVKVATVARNAGDALDIELYGVECTYDWYNASFASAEAQEPETQA